MKQIFKVEPLYEYLKVILDKFCIKENNYYVIDYITFKKIVFHNYQYEWLSQLLEHYYKSNNFTSHVSLAFNLLLLLLDNYVNFLILNMITFMIKINLIIT
jgi:hypothetical protein